MGRSITMAKQQLKLFMLRHEQGGYAIKDGGGDNPLLRQDDC